MIRRSSERCSVGADTPRASTRRRNTSRVREAVSLSTFCSGVSWASSTICVPPRRSTPSTTGRVSDERDCTAQDGNNDKHANEGLEMHDLRRLDQPARRGGELDCYESLRSGGPVGLCGDDAVEPPGARARGWCR